MMLTEYEQKLAIKAIRRKKTLFSTLNHKCGRGSGFGGALLVGSLC